MKRLARNADAPRICVYCKTKFSASSPEDACLTAPDSPIDVCHDCFGLAVDRLYDAGRRTHQITDLRVIEYLDYGLCPPVELEDR